MRFSYILRRLGTLIFVLFGISLVTFLIIQLIPGDPARVALGVQATPEAVAVARQRLGLDRPLPVQYFEWVGGILRGDFGRSLLTGRSITDLVVQRIPATLTLAFAALLVGLAIALPLGILAALRPGSRVDLGAMIFSQFGVSIPDFWLGIMLIVLFAETMQLLPSSGYAPITAGLGPWLNHLILPAVTAGVISGAIQARFVRSATLEVIHHDYVRTARAKGLAERIVVGKHILRNASIPIVTIIGLQMATLMSQIVVVEIVFAWPGLGRLALDATLSRDYPVLQAAVLLIAAIFAVTNLVADLAYAVLDPRIEYG